MNCPYCGKNLYKEISFFELFNPKYEVHVNCRKSLKITYDVIYLPYQESFLFFCGILSKKDVFNPEYFFRKYVGKVLYEFQKKDEWSIIIFFDDVLQKDTLKLVYYLAVNGLFIVSLYQQDICFIEDLL